MLNVIKVDIENDYQVMSMAVTRLNDDPKAWNVHEFDGDKVSNTVMIIYSNFILVNTRWYLRWRKHEYGYESWVKNPFEYNKYKYQIDFPRLDGIVNGIRREKQINEILK